MAAGRFPGLGDEGSQESSSRVVGQLQENGPSLVRVVLPSVRLHHDGQGGVPVVKIGGAWIAGFDGDRIDRELARRVS